ncbi:unnamed protein product [Closterium sp. NIES-53]
MTFTCHPQISLLRGLITKRIFSHPTLLPQIWEEAYGLKQDIHLPPAKITLPDIVPRAPHLEDCEALTSARRESERRGGDGQPPLWARRADNCSSKCSPQPPWVLLSFPPRGLLCGRGLLLTALSSPPRSTRGGLRGADSGEEGVGETRRGRAAPSSVGAAC